MTLAERRIFPEKIVLSIQAAQSREFGGVQVGDGPVIHRTGHPMDQVIAVPREGGLGVWRGLPGPNEQVNYVKPPMIDEGRHPLPVHIFHTAAYKWKPLGRKIPNVRGKIEFAGKPWLHGVLVGRRDIYESGTYERPNVVSQNDVCQIRVGWARAHLDDIPGDRREKKH